MTRRTRYGVLLVSCVLALAAPFVLPTSYYVHIAILVLLFAFLGTAWNILAGIGGQHSFGHALFVGTGAYVTALLPRHLGIVPWLAILLGGITALVVGAFVGYISFRYEIRGAFFLLVTIAFAEIALLVVLNVRALGGASGVVVPPSDRPWLDFQFTHRGTYYYVILAMLALVLLFVGWIKGQRFGTYLQAIRENEDAARALGINVFRWKLLACCVSASLCGIAGGFYAQYYLFVDPLATLGLTLSVQIAIVAIVGGLGTLAGPTVGALVLIPATEAIRSAVGVNAPGVHLVAYGAVLIVVMLWMPRGIMGGLAHLAEALRRWRSRPTGHHAEPVGDESRPANLRGGVQR